MILAIAPRPAVAAESREYDLKAAFLYNFVQFVDWPDNVFASPEAPFIIGVLGENPFGSSLGDLVAGETAGGRRIVVRLCGTLEEASTSNLLFISRSKDQELARIIPGLADRGILTVGESDRFSEQGGIIRFLLSRNRLRLRINMASAKTAGLTISSKLLRQAEITGGVP